MTARVEPLSRAQGVAALISDFTGVRPCCGSRLCSAGLPVFVGGAASVRDRDAIVAAGAEVVGTDIAAGVERIQGALAGVQASTG